MMKTQFMVEGSHVTVMRLNTESALDHLPPQVYTLRFNQLTGFYLTLTKDQLELPETIYGDTPKRVDRCPSTYQDRDAATGILLTGDKGTGKTLLMSLLANKVITDLKLPVILIKEAYTGDQFASFIELLGECCIVLDEFGKMYTSSRHHDDRPHQDNLLSLLDGVDKTKRMVIMTENSELDISESMMNRPSRVYYHFRYKKLDESSIIGYSQDHGIPKAVVRDIVDLSRRSKIFSFDMLQSIVEEYNRFETSIEDVIADLNIDIREEFGVDIEIMKVIRKVDEVELELFGSAIVQKPAGNHGYSYIKIKKDATKNRPRNKADEVMEELGISTDDEESYDEIYIELSDLAYESAGKMVFDTKEYTITAKEVPQKHVDYYKMF